jgi:CubicO group peptidase (beta-lactamase class C family)
MMTTNGDWAVPAGADARRFLMLDADGEVMPRGYFDALWAEAEGGGVAAMLHDLLAVDLRGFNPRAVPTTSALVEQQRRSADDITQWITDAVINAELIPNTAGGGFRATWSFATLHNAYLNWVSTHGGRRPKSAREFGRALGKLRLTRGAGNNPPRWTIPDCATLLASADRRAGIRSVPR